MSIFQILEFRSKTTLGQSLEQLSVDQDGLVQIVVVYRGETFQIEIFLSYLSCMKRNMKPSKIIKRRKQWQQLQLVVLLVVLVGSGRPGSADRIYAVPFFYMYYTVMVKHLLPRTYQESISYCQNRGFGISLEIFFRTLLCMKRC